MLYVICEPYSDRCGMLGECSLVPTTRQAQLDRLHLDHRDISSTSTVHTRKNWQLLGSEATGILLSLRMPITLLPTPPPFPSFPYFLPYSLFHRFLLKSI